jgi:hypothetical protein
MKEKEEKEKSRARNLMSDAFDEYRNRFRNA